MNLNHRKCLHTTVCTIAACFLSLASLTEATERRPNIVVLLADDMTWSDCQPYGSPNIKTPNMQKLADQGMRFDNMFTATAMCAPTRQQLYTGLFPVRNGAFPNHSKVREGVKSMVHHLSELGYQVSLAGKKHIGPGKSFPFKSIRLNNILKSKSRPFCHILASRDPHKPWTSGDASEFAPDKIIVPPNLIDTPHTRKSLCQYYAEIRTLDNTLGQIMKLLDEAGEADNTILIFTSEQGMTLPFGGKWSCYDTGLKTGFIVRWPGVVKPGSSTQALTQYVDVVPTLVKIAGGDPTQVHTGCKDANGHTGFDGRNFLPILRSETEKFREFVYGVQTTKGIGNGQSYPIRSVRDTRYKYIININHKSIFQNVYTEGGKYHEQYFLPLLAEAEKSPSVKQRLDFFQSRPHEELYDVQEDPYELINLAESPEYASIKKKLAQELKTWMQQQGDKGLETEELARIRESKPKKGKGEKKK